jgi:hypothetical protein
MTFTRPANPTWVRVSSYVADDHREHVVECLETGECRAGITDEALKTYYGITLPADLPGD